MRIHQLALLGPFTLSFVLLGTNLNAVPSEVVLKWKQFLNWLPEDTETVFVAQGSFTVVEPKSLVPNFSESAFFFVAAGPMFSLQDGLLHKALAGRKVVCAVEGSRRFTTPNDLGLMPYQGAHLIEFDAVAHEAVSQSFKECLAASSKPIELGGQRIAVFTEKKRGDVWNYFIAHPKPGLLICATERGFLEDVLKRMSDKPTKRALPEDLPEWKQVDVTAPIWAVRHYVKETAEKDPSSPLGEKSPPGVADAAAVGIVFWYTSQPEKVARVRYLSGAADALKIVTRVWNQPTEELTPLIRTTEFGSVEVVVPMTSERTARMLLFVLMWQLGHAINV